MTLSHSFSAKYLGDHNEGPVDASAYGAAFPWGSYEAMDPSYPASCPWPDEEDADREDEDRRWDFPSWWDRRLDHPWRQESFPDDDATPDSSDAVKLASAAFQ